MFATQIHRGTELSSYKVMFVGGVPLKAGPKSAGALEDCCCCCCGCWKAEFVTLVFGAVINECW